ncbi:HD domain-containing phosphohydrolase [Serpentinicella sp. ANB-PHB4]|uniref:HD-GYP domain-containing protein n=1 Tax=Serpentinicella sp. ANB-PHB4 TaxID=3074076 RepID=UPI00285E2AA3|nr:HD domain-containing phosphohydrolase [Serpentinicella sp. ANB-PHB4]MDR5659258.1 HD domain-containing phosphohydrolase [Serpentinicella sp. ANB-PHB4]
MNRLNVSALLEGMVVSEPVICPSTNEVLLGQGTKLTDFRIKGIRKRGIKVVSVVDRFTLSVDPIDSIRKELKKLLLDEITRLAPDIVEGNTSNRMADVSRRVRKIAQRITTNDKILEFCAEMKIIDNDFLYKHSVATCVMSLLVEGAMDLKESEIYNVGIAGLLHDVGLRETPYLLNGKKRNKQEESAWGQHPTYGYYITREVGMGEDITNMILSHHENWNGSGYPNGLEGKDIPLGARIISVCENYDRLIRLEKYPHHQAIEFLYGGGNYYFDAKVTCVFTENLSVYPLGSLVRLSTGEVGVVVNVRKNLGPRPIVRIYYNRVNRPLAQPKDIDLGRERTVFINEVLK